MPCAQPCEPTPAAARAAAGEAADGSHIVWPGTPPELRWRPAPLLRVIEASSATASHGAGAAVPAGDCGVPLPGRVSAAAEGLVRPETAPPPIVALDATAGGNESGASSAGPSTGSPAPTAEWSVAATAATDPQHACSSCRMSAAAGSACPKVCHHAGTRWPSSAIAPFHAWSVGSDAAVSRNEFSQLRTPSRQRAFPTSPRHSCTARSR